MDFYEGSKLDMDELDVLNYLDELNVDADRKPMED